MSRMWQVLIAAATLVTAASACMAAGTPSQTPTGGQPGGWHMVMQMSGGFDGLDRVLDVSSTGAVTATDRVSRSRVTGRLAVNELSRLSALAHRRYPQTVAAPRCPDCRVYELEIRDGSGTSSWQLSDVNRSGDKLDPLVTTLVDVLERTLSGRLPPP